LAPQLYITIGWLPTALIVAVPATALMFLFTRKGKERFVNKDTEPITLKALFAYVKGNKYLLIFFSGFTVMNITSTAGTVAAYFAEHNLKDPGMTSANVACLALPAFLTAALMPTLTKRLDKFQIFLFCAIANLIMSPITYFIGYSNLVAFFILVPISGILSGGVLITQLMFTGDFVEYGEFKTGKRMQGIAYSLQTFTFKFFNAIPVAGAMFILGFVGLVEGTNIVQNPATVEAIWILFSVFPAVGTLISIPIMLKYTLRDKDVQLMARVNSGEMKREEAEKLF
jgi:Na+/melibiose symporter-like transporter